MRQCVASDAVSERDRRANTGTIDWLSLAWGLRGETVVALLDTENADAAFKALRVVLFQKSRCLLG